MTLKRMVLLMMLAAMLAVTVVASAVPAMGQDFFPNGFDTSNWEPSYYPDWCYDPYYQAAVAQYVGWDQVNYDCGPGPVVN